MLDRVIRELGETLRGIAGAVRARKTLFAAVTAGVFVMDIVVPPAVLSLSRKPVDYFTFNPWLAKLPEYLSSGPGPLGQRLEKVWSLALFWFSSDALFDVEWGFAVTVADLARFLVMGCGAPVIPVVGLAFVGLSSGTLKWMSELSSIGTAVVLMGMALGVLYLGWRVGSPRGVRL